MKKIFALIAALFLGMVALAGPAAATNDEDDNKKITVCHYKGNNGANKGTYTKVEVPIHQFFGGDENGHGNHTAYDIWAETKYVEYSNDENGDVVRTVKTIPANGDQSRLQYKNCKVPDDDVKIAQPEPTFADPCGVKNDVDLAVAPGEGYKVGPLVKDGAKQSITVTLIDGYVWNNGKTEPLVFTRTFTAEDCSLPQTGGEATYNTVLGGAALAGVVILGGLMLLTRRKRS